MSVEHHDLIHEFPELKLRIPDEGCHLIHANVATHSTGRLPPIPEQSCHP